MECMMGIMAIAITMRTVIMIMRIAKNTMRKNVSETMIVMMSSSIKDMDADR